MAELEPPFACRRPGVNPEHRRTRRLAPCGVRRDLAYLVPVSEEHVVVRDAIEVMLVRVPDEISEIQRAWAAFEAAVGLRGRKFYGAFDAAAGTYSVCAVLRPGDDPSAFGAERATLPGGRYACVRLNGEPPAVYEHIGPDRSTPGAATRRGPESSDARVLPPSRRHRRTRARRLRPPARLASSDDATRID